MKIESLSKKKKKNKKKEIFINIPKTVQYLGTVVATKLSEIHLVKGCDTPTFLHCREN